MANNGKKSGENRKAPWMKFYPADWRSDAKLRLCSYAARGLWVDLLTLMHEAEPYGELRVSGIAPSSEDLAMLLGGKAREIDKLLNELEKRQVFSRRDDGAIYSRRMERDALQAQRDRDFGRLGGSPNLKPKDGPPDGGLNGHDKALVNGGVNPPLKAQKLESESRKKGKQAAATEVLRLREAEAPPDLSPPLSVPEPQPVVPRLASSPKLLPRLTDPPDRWLCLSDKREVDATGVTRPVISGHYVDLVAKEVCETAKINLASWRGNWQPILTWLKLGIDVHGVILPTVKRLAARPGYPAPPMSLNFFHAAVMEAAGLVEEAA